MIVAHLLGHFSTDFVIKVDIIAAAGIEVTHTATTTAAIEVANRMDQTGSIVNVGQSELMVLDSAVDTVECCYLDHKLVELAINIKVVTNTTIDSFDIDPKQVVVLKALLHHQISCFPIILKLLRKAFMLLVTYLNCYS